MNITDEGVCGLAIQVAELKWIDLTATLITDTSVQMLKDHCPETLQIVLNSCRSVSRKVRVVHAKRASDSRINSKIMEIQY